MPKKKIAILSGVILAVIVAFIISSLLIFPKAEAEEKSETMQTLSIWQIDGFEGGKGSRAQYLQNTANACFKGEKVYATVNTLSADAARENLARGVKPDIISYNAAFYGIENYINKKDFAFKTWCRGGYCLLSLDENCDFSDVNEQNTAINAGKDNLVEAAATLCGVGNASYFEPTNAYLQLISGKFKYLFGTQRDIYRLKTRNQSFAVKPMTQFNDLYQNVSILCNNAEKYVNCVKFVNYLTENAKVDGLGLISDACEAETEELKILQAVAFDYVLNYPCGKDYVEEIKTAAKNRDANKIKTLLK